MKGLMPLMFHIHVLLKVGNEKNLKHYKIFLDKSIFWLNNIGSLYQLFLMSIHSNHFCINEKFFIRFNLRIH